MFLAIINKLYSIVETNENESEFRLETMIIDIFLLYKNIILRVMEIIFPSNSFDVILPHSFPSSRNKIK
jgi:hypothetical protein